jgi:hypothetical protein
MSEQAIRDAEERIIHVSNYCVMYAMAKGLPYDEGLICFSVTARLMKWNAEHPNAPESECVALGMQWTREELEKLYGGRTQ